MDDAQKPTPDSEKPGAPELDKSVTVPGPQSAPLNDEPQQAPAFQPTPTGAAADQQPEPADEEDNVRPYETATEEHQARTDYLRGLRKSKPDSHKFRSLFIVLLIVGLLGVLGVVGMLGYLWWGMRDSGGTKQPVAANNQTATVKQPGQKTKQQQSTTTDTKDYTSISLGVSLTYPSDWVEAEQNGVLTVTSPALELTDATGQAQTGQIVFRVRSGQAELPEFDNGTVVAVMASEKLKYSKPSSIQRGSTYISYLQFPETTTKGGLDAIYVTGDAGYKYAQVVSKGDVARVDPKISVDFVTCADSACAAGAKKAPLTISSSTWNGANKDAVDAMFKSIVLN